MGLLQPLPSPSSPLEVISMDFVQGLPKSGSTNSILVVIDKFSKLSHFVPLGHPFTTETMARQAAHLSHGSPLLAPPVHKTQE
jgi:hypothetical protein